MDIPQIERVNPGYVGVVNSDTTEGRGFEVYEVHSFAPIVAKDAVRGKSVQGSDGYVIEVPFVMINGKWYGPINLSYPDEEQKARGLAEIERQERIQKAKDLGLTDEDIEIIRSTDR